MSPPARRVEFDRAAARELRKLGVDAERRVLRYLRAHCRQRRPGIAAGLAGYVELRPLLRAKLSQFTAPPGGLFFQVMTGYRCPFRVT